MGGASYGQGSSREHAAICPMYLGVRVVMAKSFERIHAVNLINFGILPLTFSSESDYNDISLGQEFIIRGLRGIMERPDLLPVEVGGKVYTMKINATKRQKEILIKGGLLNFTKQ